jgi:hypothetical protein
MSLPALVTGGELNFQQLSTVQGSQSPMPSTLAAATTIAPTTFITFVSGTTNVGTITPPVAGQHMLVLIFTNGSPGQILTTGNVNTGSTTVTQNVPVLVFYNPPTAKYYLR